MSREPRADTRLPEVDALVASTNDLYGTITGLTAEELIRRPAPGEWSAWDIAYHIVQIEVWYLAKLCEASAADTPEAMHNFLDAWRLLRQRGLELARAIPEDRLDTAGLLSGVPNWTPRGLLDAIAAHDREHREQARAALGGAEPAEPA